MGFTAISRGMLTDHEFANPVINSKPGIYAQDLKGASGLLT